MVSRQIDHVLLGGWSFSSVASGSKVLGGPLFDIGEVVVAGPHLGSQRDVGHSGPITGLEVRQTRTTDLNVRQRPVQPDQGL